MRFGIGQPVRRKEDPRCLTGRERYVADIDLDPQAHAVFICSAHAHALIRTIDKTAGEPDYPARRFLKKFCHTAGNEAEEFSGTDYANAPTGACLRRLG
jgi:hypothetical protein